MKKLYWKIETVDSDVEQKPVSERILQQILKFGSLPIPQIIKRYTRTKAICEFTPS